MGVDQMGRGLRVSTPRPALFWIFFLRRNLVNGGDFFSFFSLMMMVYKRKKSTYDHDIQSSPFFHCCSDQCFYLLRIRHVGFYKKGTIGAILLVDAFVCRSIGFIVILLCGILATGSWLQVCAYDFGAFFGKCEGRRSSDAG